MTGIVSYHAGFAAEDCVIRHYRANGWRPLARRWRGIAGEIDLILVRDGQLAIVEVKKSTTWALAASRLSGAQLHRIEATMLEFLQTWPGGMSADVTCDAALVDAAGRVDVRTGALSYDALAA